MTVKPAKPSDQTPGMHCDHTAALEQWQTISAVQQTKGKVLQELKLLKNSNCQKQGLYVALYEMPRNYF